MKKLIIKRLHFWIGCVTEGCTLTVNPEHGIKFCAMDMVKCDLLQRKEKITRMSDAQLRTKLELILREEEEWESMVMYRRDKRFVDVDGEYNHKLQLDRTILDMLHAPMRMHEKVLNLLYAEVLNGKTKHEVNNSRRSKVYIPPMGVLGVGERIAKEFLTDKGELQLFAGTVRSYKVEDGTGFYAIKFDDGDEEEFDSDDYADAHQLGLALTTVVDTEESLQDKKMKSKYRPALDELTNVIRELGSLGELWTHQWSEGNKKSLKKIALPFDQSKKIFKVEQLEVLQSAVYIAVPASKPELRAKWVDFLREYVHAIELMTKSVDYVVADIDTLEGYIDRAYQKLLQIAGIEGLTNYFHYFGSGHIVWMTRIHGNLWRHRNEGVEGMNGVLSLRYNKFNNRGGNKGRSKDGINEKCEAFEVLGSWLSRLIMWQLGLGDKIFVQEDGSKADDKVVLWRSGRRILYQPTDVDAGHAPRVEGNYVEELDRWVAEEGIFQHADEFINDEVAYAMCTN
jgi:hypothetical protein